MIEIKDVTKSFSDTTPVRNLNLEIERGEFVCVTGPSGSGKTTLLNLVAGLLTPTRGEVVHAGRSLYGLSQKDRVAFRRQHFGFIFQTFNLIPYLTAVENIEVPLYLAGTKPTLQRQMALELLEKFGLQEKSRHFPSQLSTGEQQRVAIARAIANGPRVLFADEPTGNLDTENGLEVIRHLEALNENGVTVLLVTHDLAMAHFAERQITLCDGGLS